MTATRRRGKGCAWRHRDGSWSSNSEPARVTTPTASSSAWPRCSILVADLRAPEFPSAYCVQRVGQLFGGHAIDHDDRAIARLALWTLLTIRWPLLAEHLTRVPDHVAELGSGKAPEGTSDELKSVFELADLVAFARQAAEVELDAAAIRRFTAPIAFDTEQLSARRPQAEAPVRSRARPRDGRDDRGARRRAAASSSRSAERSLPTTARAQAGAGSARETIYAAAP